MQTAVVLMTEAGEDDGAFVSTPVAVGVIPGDEIGRISDVKFAAAPSQAHGIDELIDKHTCGFITAITIAVFKHCDPTLPGQRSQFGVEIKAGRLRDKQPSPLVERGEHGKNRFRWTCNFLDGETGRNMKIGDRSCQEIHCRAAAKYRDDSC